MLNKKLLFIFLGFLFLFLFSNFISADSTIVSNCGTLSSPGLYELNQTITSTTTCLTIANSNIELDCKGNTIFYNTAGGATNYGINAIYLLVPLENITIKNCIILDTTAAGTPASAIQFTRVTDSYIFNNTIQSNGTTLNHGITLTTSCRRNRIENNTINTYGTGIGNYGIYFLTDTSSNTIIGNIINGVGSTTSSALYFTADVNHNIIHNNTLTTLSTSVGANTDCHVVQISASNNNSFTENYIYGQGVERGYAIYIIANSEENNIENNTIIINTTSVADLTYGVFVSAAAKYNSIINNNITPIGLGSLRGVQVTSSQYTIVRNNFINIIEETATTADGVALGTSPGSWVENNFIHVSAYSTIRGVTSTSSAGSSIQNNSIYLFGNTTVAGVLLTTSADNIIESNIINISGLGAATTFQGISATTAAGSSIKNNSIYINGVTALNGILLTSSPNISLNSNIVNIFGSGAARVFNGIYALTSASSSIKNNSIYINGITTLNGIISTTSDYSTIDSNNITILGFSTATTFNGVSSSTSITTSITNNQIEISGATILNGVLVTTCSSNTIENNTLNVSGTGVTNVGIYLTAQTIDSVVRNNSMVVSASRPSHGIYVLSSISNLIEQNTMSTTTTATGTATSHAPSLFLSTGSNNNTIRNNTIIASGSYHNNHGVYIVNSDSNLIESNNISTSGTTTNHGVYISTQAGRNIIKDNTIVTGGQTTLYGVYILSSNSNHIIGNYILVNGSNQTVPAATNNYGIFISTSSYFSEAYNNTILTGGVGSNFGIYNALNSRWGIFSGNNIHSGGTGTLNYGVWLSESHYNIFEDNNISTSGTTTNYGIYLYSSSRENTIKKNNITTSGGTDSHAFYLLYLAAGGWPEGNIFQGNNLINIAGKDINFGTASINGTNLVDQTIGDYAFSGNAGSLIIENTSAGKISFAASLLSGTNTTFSDRIYINKNYAFITTDVATLNKPAEITLYNLQTRSTELYLARNGVACNEFCTNLTSLQARNVTFNVTEGGNYSILSTTAVPSLILNYPEDIFNTSEQIINFNFTASDDASLVLNCSIYIDSVLSQTNSSTTNNTLTNFIIENLTEGAHSWYVECFDEGYNINIPETRNIYINITPPSVNLIYPNNDSYLNNVNSIRLNYTAYDNNNLNMTTWIYGDNLLLSTSENILNNTNLTYVWENLSLGTHNWTVITNNGFYNSTNTYYVFNIINLTIDCQAGGPYLENPTVLIQGTIQDNSGLVLLNSQTVNLSIYNSTGNLVDSKNTLSGSSGIFNELFIGLNINNYTVSATVYYEGITINDSTSFIIAPGYDAGYNAGFIAGNESGYIAGFINGNITGFNLGNISGFIFGNTTGFILGNATGFIEGYSLGNTTGFILGNESGYILGNATGFAIGNYSGFLLGYTTGFIEGNLTGFIAGNESGYITGFNDGNATGFAIGNYSGFLLGNLTGFYFGNQTGYEQGFIEGQKGPALLILDKIVSFYNFTNDTFTYNITLKITNAGKNNATSVNIIDYDSDEILYPIGTLESKQTETKSYLKTFDRNSTTNYFQLSIAQSLGIDSFSDSLIYTNSSSTKLTIPSQETGEQITIIKSISSNNWTLTTVNYTSTIQFVNSGGIDLEGVAISDDNLNLSEEINLNRTESYTSIGEIIINREQTNSEELLSTARAFVNSVWYYSNAIEIIIPGYGNGPNDLTVDAPASVSTSTPYSTTITIVNMNKDIGQDFTIDYWATNNLNTTNYSTGSKTLFVAADSGSNSTLVNFNSPSAAGTYIFMAKVRESGKEASDSFEVTASPSEDTGGDSGGGSGGGSITGEVIQEVICNPPYMRYGLECCLDTNNNTICDKDETSKIIQKDETTDEETPKKESQFFESIKNIMGNVGEFFSSIGKSISQNNRNNFFIGLEILILLIIVFLIKKTQKRKPKNSTRLTDAIGKEVYTEDGNIVGNITDIYLCENKPQIYGWLINTNKLAGNKKILVKHQDISCMGEIMILKQIVCEKL